MALHCLLHSLPSCILLGLVYKDPNLWFDPR